MISSKDAENCNDDHWSNGEYILQGKTKREQFVWPRKMQAERRAISRTILAQDQMGITQPRIEFSLEARYCLQCLSPARVKARSYKTIPGPFARSPQENLGQRGFDWLSLGRPPAHTRVWAHSKVPSWPTAICRQQDMLSSSSPANQEHERCSSMAL